MSTTSNEDPEHGWVERQVIRNVFQTALRKIEDLLPKSDRYPIREAVISHFESVKYELLKRSKSTDEILAKRPTKTPSRDEPAPDTKASHESRLSAIRTRGQT